MFTLLLVIAGLVLLVLAGAKVSGKRFAPEWYGLACLAAAHFASLFERL